MSVSVDHAGLASIAGEVRAAGQRIDESAGSAPTSTDAGLASDLLASVLATAGDAITRLAYEAHHIAETADACNAAYQSGDLATSQSLDLLMGGMR